MTLDDVKTKIKAFFTGFGWNKQTAITLAVVAVVVAMGVVLGNCLKC